MSSLANPRHFPNLGLQSSPQPSPQFPPSSLHCTNSQPRKPQISFRKHPHLHRPIACFDDDFGGSWFDDVEGEVVDGDDSYTVSSSDGEEGFGDLIVNSVGEVDLPVGKDSRSQEQHFGVGENDGAFTVVAYRFANIERGLGKNRRLRGVVITIGLLAFLILFLLLMDSCAWRIIKVPLEPYYLTHPFIVSTVLSAFAGWLYIPIADSMKLHSIRRKRWPIPHSSKRAIRPLGGLSFISVGITVAKVVGLNSVEVNGIAAVTLAFASIGLLDDILSGMRKRSYGLPLWIKLFLQVAAGMWFSTWLEQANISTPYSMKWLIPLPPPHGLVFLGEYYRVLTAVCFVAIGNGVNIADELDGLAGGVAAAAFIGLSIAVLPISTDVAVFGVSMAGACMGFLFHNRYKASLYMGSIGSLALGGALAAVASCTGMFLPLLISSGLFVMEIVLVIMQVIFLLATRRIFSWRARYIFQLAPLYCHLRLYGLSEPQIVACAYTVSCILTLFAGHLGLVSA